MNTPDITKASFLSAVPDRGGSTAAELVGRIETRLAESVAGLEAVRQEAAALGVGASTVHQLIRTGELGSRKIGGSRRIPVADLDAFIARLPDRRIGA